MEFKDRLKSLRLKELGGLEKQQLADKLKISPALYSLLESGKRQPSKSVLKNLEELTGKNEIWWLHGIDDKLAYINQRQNWNGVKKTLETLYEEGLIAIDERPSGEVLNVILDAINLDLKHRWLKNIYKK